MPDIEESFTHLVGGGSSSLFGSRQWLVCDIDQNQKRNNVTIPLFIPVIDNSVQADTTNRYLIYFPSVTLFSRFVFDILCCLIRPCLRLWPPLPTLISHPRR